MALQGKPSAAGRFVSTVWSFPDRDDAGSRSPYRWYGTLPVGLVEQLLELYTTPLSHVLDPFSGSGTVGITAARRGLQSTNLDVNPLAVLLARSRAHSAGPAALAGTWASVERTVNDDRFQRDASSRLARALELGELAYIAKWFSREVLERTWALVRAVSATDDRVVAATLLVHTAAAIRAVANVDPRCTHHLVTKIKPHVDPVAVVASAVRSDAREQCNLEEADFRQGDVRSLVPERAHDLVVAHPPYLGVIHYNQIHRLTTDLFSLAQSVDDPVGLRGLDWTFTELKAADMSTDNSDRYEHFLEQVADSLAKSTSVGGRVVVIIGDQRHKGLLRHPFTSYVRELEARGLALEENFIWVLQNNGGMHVLRRGHFIDHNYVMVFKRLP